MSIGKETEKAVQEAMDGGVGVVRVDKEGKAEHIPQKDIIKPRKRTLADALVNARRIEAEFPEYIQPSVEDYDMVILANEVKRLAVLETINE